MAELFTSWLLLMTFFYFDFLAVLVGSRPAG